MSNATYQLSSLNQLFDLSFNTRAFRDHANYHVFNKQELLAQITSNDYFAMLATSLDEISQRLEVSRHSDYILLEKIINDLLFLQDHYKINKK